MSTAYTLACYQPLGISIPRLGCVMLDLEPADPLSSLPEEWLYTSTDPDMRHVSGLATEHHTTLLFGLLRNAHEWLFAIDEVLADWQLPGPLEVSEVHTFPSPKASEPYSCIVGLLDSDDLRDAHARLSLLPHINTHPTYRPHVTLAYVHQRHEADAAAIFSTPARFVPLGLNYGDPR